MAQYCSRLLGGLAPPNLSVLICKWGALPRCLLPEVFQGPKRMVLLQRRVQTSGKGRGKGGVSIAPHPLRVVLCTCRRECPPVSPGDILKIRPSQRSTQVPVFPQDGKSSQGNWTGRQASKTETISSALSSSGPPKCFTWRPHLLPTEVQESGWVTPKISHSMPLWVPPP